jgi:hypothetical protein
VCLYHPLVMYGSSARPALFEHTCDCPNVRHKKNFLIPHECEIRFHAAATVSHKKTAAYALQPEASQRAGHNGRTGAVWLSSRRVAVDTGQVAHRACCCGFDFLASFHAVPACTHARHNQTHRESHSCATCHNTHASARLTKPRSHSYTHV